MTAPLDALVRELADAIKPDAADVPVRLRKGVIFAQSPLTAKIGGSDLAVPVQATGPIPANGTVVWVLESGPRRILLDVSRAAATPAGMRGQDTRTVNDTPAQMDTLLTARLGDDGQSMSAPEFKTNASIGLPGSGFSGVVTISPWGDDSGGGLHQIAFSQDSTGNIPGLAAHSGGWFGSLWYRYGTRSAGWFAWRPLNLGDASWFAPTFVNGSNYGQGYQNLGYRKGSDGFVNLRGMVNVIAGQATLFTLPVGYRPAAQVLMTSNASGPTTTAHLPRIDVMPSGAVLTYQSGAGWFTLDGLRFWPEQ